MEVSINSIKQEDNQKKEIETMKIVLSENLPKPTLIGEDKIKSFGYHKTLLGYLHAYFNHSPIRISPNIIWQLILNNFSKYVNDNAEILRNKFVNFENKKNLICVRIGHFKLEDTYKYEDVIIEEFCNKISENIGKELIDNLTPNFSTSTKQTIVSGKVSIMSTFERYFNYEFRKCICGIPYIILEGNLSDWEKILEKLKYLSKYGFKGNFIENMEKDIIEIINTKKGKINLDFWRKIIMETKEITEKRNPCLRGRIMKVEKSVINGWILHFYEKEAVEINQINGLPKEEVEAPILVVDLQTGEKKNGIIHAGIRDLKQDPNNFEVEPIINYCLSFNEKLF